MSAPDTDLATVEEVEPSRQALDGGAPAQASTASETAEDLHVRNMEAFKRHVHPLYEALSDFQPRSTLIYTEDGDPDVEFRGECLYQRQGAKAYARAQLDTFWETPSRVVQGLPDSRGLDPHAGAFATRVLKKAIDGGMEFTQSHMRLDSFFLVVMGVGLGLHIDELVEKSNCQHLILIEPNLEFLHHSTFVYDWEKLLGKMTGDRGMQFVTESNPENLGLIIQSTIRGVNPAALDGTYFFTHYYSALFERAHQKLLKEGDLSVGMMGLGFFEDEINMIAQSRENLRCGSARIMDDIPGTIPIPVFIVAAGPSLDQCIDFIKENQDNAVIIGCGSALDSLMAAGIMPDFLVLLERDPALLPYMTGSSKEFDLSGICLVGATNIYPGVSALYDETIFFFRPGLSSFPLLACKPENCMTRSDPLVANGALSFAQRVGFQEYYFFGVDVGAKNPDYHHSKNSWYDSKGMEMDFGFDCVVPGNFGGTVSSAQVYMWSKQTLELSIKGHFAGRHYYNCSDGALIQDATPRHVSTVSLPRVTDKRRIVRELIDKFPIYTTEDSDRAWREADLENAIAERGDALVEALSAVDLRDMRYLTECMKILKPQGNQDGVAMLLRGTAWQMLMVVHGYGQRINDEDREAFQDIVREEFAATVEELNETALELFASTESGNHAWNT